MKQEYLETDAAQPHQRFPMQYAADDAFGAGIEHKHQQEQRKRNLPHHAVVEFVFILVVPCLREHHQTHIQPHHKHLCQRGFRHIPACEAWAQRLIHIIQDNAGGKLVDAERWEHMGVGDQIGVSQGAHTYKICYLKHGKEQQLPAQPYPVEPCGYVRVAEVADQQVAQKPCGGVEREKHVHIWHETLHQQQIGHQRPPTHIGQGGGKAKGGCHQQCERKPMERIEPQRAIGDERLEPCAPDGLWLMLHAHQKAAHDEEAHHTTGGQFHKQFLAAVKQHYGKDENASPRGERIDSGRCSVIHRWR